jgi:hypothetical protein
VSGGCTERGPSAVSEVNAMAEGRKLGAARPRAFGS